MKTLRLALFASIAAASMAPEGVASGIGSSPIKTIVHKSDCEGSLEIDPITGNIVTLLADRPEWAEGLTVAQITERHSYYAIALGENYSAEMKVPDVLAFEDVSWLAVRPLEGLSPEDWAARVDEDPNFDGYDHYEVDASQEFRSQIVANVLGIGDDIASMERTLLEGGEVEGAISLDAEILADNLRSQEELEALEASRTTGFGKVANG